MLKEEKLVSMGYSFGDTDIHQKVEDAPHSKCTVRVETQLCQFGYLDPGSLLFIMTRHSQRKEEKMLNIVRNLPYFKGITRSTALRVSKFLEKQNPVLN